jgi:hypothetical protein
MPEFKWATNPVAKSWWDPPKNGSRNSIFIFNPVRVSIFVWV